MNISRWPFRATSPLVVSLLVTLAFAGGANGAAADAYYLRHGVVVDGTRGVAYVARPDGAIEAVRLSDGSSAWQSAEAALPLAVGGTLLAAQVEDVKPGSRLRVVILDIEARGRKVTEAAAELPAEVYALIADDLQRSFRATATADHAGFLVSWSYRQTVVEGIARDPGAPRPERTLSGTLRVDVPTATAAPVSAGRTPCRGATAVPPAALSVGSVRAVVTGGRGEALKLERWHACTGAALPVRVLSVSALTAVVSADQRHVLAGERVGKGGEADPEYRWSIFSLETGKRVGSVRGHVSAAPFFVWKNTVIFISQPRGFRRGAVWVDQPLELVGVRLTSGKQVWRRAIRDIEYRGPSPPVP